MSKSELKDWALVFDEDYDPDLDGPAGVFIAARCYTDNPHSACLALLNISIRSDNREKYDAVMKWLLDLPEGLNTSQFESKWDKRKR